LEQYETLYDEHMYMTEATGLGQHLEGALIDGMDVDCINMQRFMDSVAVRIIGSLNHWRWLEPAVQKHQLSRTTI